MDEFTRRRLLQYGVGAGAGLILWRFGAGGTVFAIPLPGGTLDPTSIPKYETPLVVPPAMPRTGTLQSGGGSIDYYEIGVRQFQQDILPQSMGRPTTVWSYGSVTHPSTFNYPAFTIEASWTTPVRVNWINQLVDANGNFLPHLLPIDQTLHWANPPGGPRGTDMEGFDPTPYTGPVPIVTHLHGGHSGQESDGFPEAWFLPAANDIPAGFATVGSHYETFRSEAEALYGQSWGPGRAVFQYDNDQPAATIWYHDHTLGMTRSNVYAGPAGFYLLRGGPGDEVGGTLPGPAPALGDPPGTKYYEIPIAIQDRAFNADGSLFYPDNRAFFEGLNQPPTEPYLDIPFIPDRACKGKPSDISPIFNPEFFGNAMVVNGKTWPKLEVEQRRYRFRFLNGCNSRFLILRLSNGLPFWQIGAEGGFLPEPVELDQLLLGLAERADVIVDFTNVSVGDTIILENLGPDEPFGGGEPDEDFDRADPDTTGQVMLFEVVPATSPDTSTPPNQLGLPEPPPIPPATRTRRVSLNEEDSRTVRVSTDESGNVVLDCADGEPFGPRFALLGRMVGGKSKALRWDDPISENPAVGATEVWEMHNFTADAHPIHIHEITFEVVNRESIETGAVRGPEPWESGRKDTVIAYPGEITRVKATFDRPGLFVWHCHIVEHEDHEMMRPYRVGPGRRSSGRS
ncbi:MAG TPA: multicopper oxidase [Solirubrobacterales bacterium]|nr:multicopper oxidase [Solirubrobacterales bacterium]